MPQFSYINMGYKGVYNARTCFPDVCFISVVKQSISVALVEAETDEILAGQTATIENKFDILESVSFKSEALAKAFGIADAFNKLCNVYYHYKVENSIHLRQLATHKDHNHKGFATKLIIERPY